MIITFLLTLALQTTQISLGNEKINVEIAKTEEALARGLMERDSLPENHGMLFVFKEPQILSFWMKNTKIPLSIAFFDEDKKLFQIIDMAPPIENEPPYRTYTSIRPALYALEVNQGWFQNHKIGPPMKFSFLD